MDHASSSCDATATRRDATIGNVFLRNRLHGQSVASLSTSALVASTINRTKPTSLENF
ncbi:MAG: hypothetical protein SH850_20940 [Planctomycetaceae bacterium]|nr:hypothetical protein [Planctomycetaceae bacterium]